jgi:hypothetical protein
MTPGWLGIPVCPSARSGSEDPASLVRTASRRRIASGHCHPDTSRCITSPRMTVPGRVRTDRIRADRIRADRIRAGRIRADRIRADRIRAGRIRADRIRAGRIRADRIRAGRMTRRGAEPSGFPARQPMAGIPASPRMPATARIPAGRPTTTWAATTATRAVMAAAGSTRTDMRPGAGSSRVSVTTTRSRTTTSGPRPAMAAAGRDAGGRAPLAGPGVPGGVGSDGSRPWSRSWLFSSR